VAVLLRGRLLGVHALRAAGQGQRLRLRVRGRPDAVHARLTGLAGVRRVSVEPEGPSDVAGYVVDADASPDLPETLAAAVVGAGFGLFEMSPTSVDLETLFLGLTGGDSEAPA